MATTKLPMDDRPLIQDPFLAQAVEALLRPYSGKALEAAQQAVRVVARGGAVGTYDEIVETYRKAIQKAAKTD